MRAKVKLTQTVARNLEPGDLFTTYGPHYWDGALDRHAIGERVYIRTNAPADNAMDADTTVYKLEIEKE